MDFETGLRAVEELKSLAPAGASLAQLALRWILEFPAGDVRHSRRQTSGTGAENMAASDRRPLSKATMKKIRALYDAQIKSLVHQYW